jgi:hypothetical protein
MIKTVEEHIGAIVVCDHSILSKEADNRRIEMTLAGAEAIAKFYYEKYKGKIIPIKSISKLEEHVRNAQAFSTNLTNARIAFWYGYGYGHIEPIVYIKEESYECLLLSTCYYLSEVKKVQKQLKIPVYLPSEMQTRQASMLELLALQDYPMNGALEGRLK